MKRKTILELDDMSKDEIIQYIYAYRKSQSKKREQEAHNDMLTFYIN